MSQHLVDHEALNSVVLILNLWCLKKGRSGWHTKLTNWYFSFKHEWYPVLEQWSLAWMFTEEVCFLTNSSEQYTVAFQSSWLCGRRCGPDYLGIWITEGKTPWYR